MSKNKRKAFTLIELLVVVSIIALLISILVPALRAAKELATSAICLTNQKGLVLAWRMYADDNNDRIVNGNAHPGEVNGYDHAKRGPPWVFPPRAAGGGPADNSTKFTVTFADRLRGLEQGALGPYTGQATDLYHCPADNREVVGTRHGPEPRYQIYRSYSTSQALSTHTGEDGQLAQFVRSNIRQPGNTIIYVEESYDGGSNHIPGASSIYYNDEFWNFKPRRYEWIDPMAQFHFGATTFSFADGHSEAHNWIEERTIEYHKDRYGPGNTIFRNTTIDSGMVGDSPDLDWMHLHVGAIFP